ncbi:DUF58 domain-containing protein [Aurantivibrio plasticivorans]
MVNPAQALSSKNSAAETSALKTALLAKGAFTELETLLKLRHVAADLKLWPLKPSLATQAGSTRTRFRGRGMEFEEVRVYQPGDDIRTIDWRVTARTQVPHTKLFREERERPTLIVLDQRSSLFFGSQRCFKSVLAAHIGVLIAWASLQHSDRVGGLVFGNTHHQDVRPQKSKHAVLELVKVINQFNHQLKSPIKNTGDQSISLSQLLEDTRRLAKPGTAVYIISDFQDLLTETKNDISKQLYLLARHCEVTLFQVFDPLERRIDTPGFFTVSDGSRRAQIRGDDKRLNDSLQAQFENVINTLKHITGPLRINHAMFSTADDELQQLRQIFRK